MAFAAAVVGAVAAPIARALREHVERAAAAAHVHAFLNMLHFRGLFGRIHILDLPEAGNEAFTYGKQGKQRQANTCSSHIYIIAAVLDAVLGEEIPEIAAVLATVPAAPVKAAAAALLAVAALRAFLLLVLLLRLHLLLRRRSLYRNEVQPTDQSAIA